MGEIEQDPLVDKKNQDDKVWWQSAVMMFARLSAWIVAPVLLATLAGKWLDNKLDSAPWGLIGIVGISFVISMAGLVMEASKEYRKIVGNSKTSKISKTGKNGKSDNAL